MLKACLNGARLRGEHPALPITAEELADDVVAVAAAGAEAVHLHVKGPDGRDTLAAEPLAEVLGAVRRAAPGMPIGVTTGAWAEPDPVGRVAAVMSWVVLPDPSVVLHGEGSSCWPALRLAARLGLDARIGLEDTLTLPDGSPAPDNASLVRAALRG